MPAISWRPAALPQRVRVVGVTAVVLVILILVVSQYGGTSGPRISPESPGSTQFRQPKASKEPAEVVMVVASQTRDDTSWLEYVRPEWQKNIYITDDSTAELTVPVNKGREGMVYLTHMIDNYDSLAPVTIFHHAVRYQWHNDDPLYDGQRLLSGLQVPYIYEKGYVNLRCVWTLGCPAEIHPIVEDQFRVPMSDPMAKEGVAKAGWWYKAAYEEIFPGTEVPTRVGASCCAQFAATAEKIRERPKEDYEGYRRWLLETDLRDDISGIVMEYVWHIIFGREAVDCPNAPECYCKLYGHCDLECQSEGVCKSQYTLPKYRTLPKGWPDYDWNGNWQNATEM